MTATAFHSLDDYLALPRVTDLAASVDGTRVVVTVAALNDKHNEYVSAIFELDGLGQNPCLLYTSPSPRDATLSRMPSSA